MLIRNVMVSHEVFDFQPMPNPISRQNVMKLMKEGEVERFLEYAERREGDSVVFALDADGGCPKELTRPLVERLEKAHHNKKVAVILFNSELRVFSWRVWI